MITTKTRNICYKNVFQNLNIHVIKGALSHKVPQKSFALEMAKQCKQMGKGTVCSM